MYLASLSRLVAKLAWMSISDRLGTTLALIQLGFGTPNGAEAAVHSARIYLDHLLPDHVMLKIDFKNAFNYVRRDKMLEMVIQHVPEIFPLYTLAIQHHHLSASMKQPCNQPKEFSRMTLSGPCFSVYPFSQYSSN